MSLRKMWPLLVIGLVLVLGLASVVVALVKGSADSADPAVSPASGARNSASAGGPEGSDVDSDGNPMCNLPPAGAAGVEPEAKDWSEATGWPVVDRWEISDVLPGLIFPVTNQFGPQIIKPNFRACFSNSQAGAVLAAANWTIGVLEAPSVGWVEYVTTGENAPAAVSFARQADVELAAVSGVRVQPIGWRFFTSLEQTGNPFPEGEVVNIDIAAQIIRDGESQVVSDFYNAVWADGDWRILPGEDGMLSDSTELSDEWSRLYRVWPET